MAVGTTQPGGFYGRLVKRQLLSFAAAAASSVVRRPWILPRLVRAVRYRGGVPVPVSGALLSSICVSPAAQGAGVGSAVLVEWLRRVAAAGVGAAYLTTDAVGNDDVNRFYSRHGWWLAGTLHDGRGPSDELLPHRRKPGAMKVMTVVGTRPEIIRLSRVIPALDQTVDHVLVHTGQNYDWTLNDVFFQDLGLREPDHALGVDTSSLGRVLGETLIRAEEVMLAERPDAVLVLGDTNSCIAAVMAKRLQIPVYHMEAGNRCFDENVPEETNRRLVDHVADFNLVYTEHARRNLLAEGLHPRRVMLTGSPMREVLDFNLPSINASDVLDRLGLQRGGYLLVSAHREENVDSPQRLRALLRCLVAARDECQVPVLVSTHPRTRKRLEALPDEMAMEGIEFQEPFGFHDYVQLQRSAVCVLSDSGTIAEESAMLDFASNTSTKNSTTIGYREGAGHPGRGRLRRRARPTCTSR